MPFAFQSVLWFENGCEKSLDRKKCSYLDDGNLEKRLPIDLFVFGWNVNRNDAIY